jgi:hypothetical protein
MVLARLFGAVTEEHLLVDFVVVIVMLMIFGFQF